MLSALSPVITDLFNHCITLSEIPKDWKFGVITPVFKKGTESAKENYRPITILTQISKAFEKVLVRQLKEHFTHIFPSDMHGFIKGLSTETALLKLQQDCIDNMDNRQSTVMVSLDLSKAFDTVHHTLLLEKLKAYGLRQCACELIHNYLHDRDQVVNVQGTWSHRFLKHRGVPQGSILGPFLFNVYVADMTSFISKSSLVRYADDTTIYHSSDNLDKTICQLNDDIHNLVVWLSCNCLILNPSKSQAMIIQSPTASSNEPANTILVDSVSLPWSVSIKLLGVPLERSLAMKGHLKNCLRKANICLHQLRQFRSCLTPALGTQLYKSYIRPHLEYCSSLLTPIYHSNLIKLDYFQSRALRILNYKGHSDTNRTQKKIPLDSLRARRTFRVIMIAQRALTGGKRTQLEDLFNKSDTKYSVKNFIKLICGKHRSSLQKWSFRSVATRLWNFLPQPLRNIYIRNFKSELKSYLAAIDWKERYVLDSISCRTV